MTEQVLITAPRHDRDWAQYSDVAVDVFAGARRDLSLHQSRAITRVAVLADQVVGGAIARETHQFFGGEAVPVGCVSDVCVRPDQRGKGIARDIVEALVAQLRANGAMVSPLWTPATGVYRRWGWEVAGLGHQWSVAATALRALPGRPGSMVAGLAPGHRRLQRELARSWNGTLRRDDTWWDWKYPEASEAQSFSLVAENGRLQGFLSYTPRPVRPWGHDLAVSQFWARDAGGGQALLRFLGSHSSMARDVHFGTGVLPAMPSLLWGLPHHDLRQDGWYPWMVRLIDTAGALTARGWPPAVHGRVEFLVDDLPPHESGKFVLEVDGGRARVTPGGSGTVRLTAGQLAAWYAGALSVPQLKNVLGTAVDDRTLSLLGTLTHSADVWLPDVF